MLIDAFASATRRILFLDYDGTLAGFRIDPAKATPSAKLLRALQTLVEDPATTVVIVTGRNHTYLSSWFSDLPLAFAAEHGCFYKDPGQTWQAAAPLDDFWKPTVRRIMQGYVTRLPGTMIAEKPSGLVWHCRGVMNRRLVQKTQAGLAQKLRSVAGSLNLRILSGKLIVEVQPLGFDKGTIAQRWLAANKHEFILAAGDDVTDEDLFRAMPPGSFTIKIGPGATHAAERLESPKVMVRLLQMLAKTAH